MNYWSWEKIFSTVGSEDDDSLEDGRGREEKEEEDSFEKEDSDADSSAVRKNQDISDIFNQVEQITGFFPHLLFTCRPLSGVKLRLEKGGGGSWARGRARERALSGPKQLGPKAGRTLLREGKLQQATARPREKSFSLASNMKRENTLNCDQGNPGNPKWLRARRSLGDLSLSLSLSFRKTHGRLAQLVRASCK